MVQPPSNFFKALHKNSKTLYQRSDPIAASPARRSRQYRKKVAFE
jgi:hypothetical protein